MHHKTGSRKKDVKTTSLDFKAHTHFFTSTDRVVSNQTFLSPTSIIMLSQKRTVSVLSIQVYNCKRSFQHLFVKTMYRPRQIIYLICHFRIFQSNNELKVFFLQSHVYAKSRIQVLCVYNFHCYQGNHKLLFETKICKISLPERLLELIVSSSASFLIDLGLSA